LVNLPKEPPVPLLSLAEQYVRSIVPLPCSGAPAPASPGLVLQDMPLAFSIADAASKIEDLRQSSGICALADSGLPLGTIIAQALHKPLYLFRGRPWSIEGDPVPHSVYCHVPEGSTISMVDSHITMGHIAATCAYYLSRRGVSVRSLFTPINLTPSAQSSREGLEGIRCHALADLPSLRPFLSRYFRTSNDAQLNEVLSAVFRRPRDPVTPSPPTVEDQALPPRSQRLMMMAKSVLRHRQFPRVQYPHQREASQLRQLFPSHEPNMWTVLTEPALLRQVTVLAQRALDLDSFDVILGTNYLGTSLALALAWHKNYAKPLISTLWLDGWDILKSMPRDTSVLVCSMRIQTGLFVAAAIRRLKKYHIMPAAVLTFRYSPQRLRLPRSDILDELSRLDIVVTAIS